MTWTSSKIMKAVKELACPRGCVKLAAIVRHTGLTGKQCANACTKLTEHGYLARQTYVDDKVKPGCYTITTLGRAALEEGLKLTSGPKGPIGKTRVRADTLRDRAWRLLRVRRKASVPELVGILIDADCDQKVIAKATNNLQRYMLYLSQAGYLAEMRREAPTSLTSNGAKRYLLTRDTGPLPPIPQVSVKKMFDPNEEKQYDIK